MSKPDNQPVNAAQIAYWNEISGPKWAALGDRIDSQIAPLGRRAMDLAAPQPGESVLDVGCGCGHTSRELAARVGASGRVVGVDISRPMLDVARESGAGTDWLSFVEADAQTGALGDGSFDLIFSRFGIMFFDDPPAAFGNLGHSLRSGGRIAWACWQALSQNPWMTVPLEAMSRHIPLPAPPPPMESGLGAPGPFAFADAERVCQLLREAGYQEVRCEALEGELVVGAGLDLSETTDFVLQLGPAGALLREADDETRQTVRTAVLDALEPYATSSGGVALAAGAWAILGTWP